MERRLPRFLFDLLTEDLDCLVNLHKIRDDAQLSNLFHVHTLNWNEKLL